MGPQLSTTCSNLRSPDSCETLITSLVLFVALFDLIPAGLVIQHCLKLWRKKSTNLTVLLLSTHGVMMLAFNILIFTLSIVSSAWVGAFNEKSSHQVLMRLLWPMTVVMLPVFVVVFCLRVKIFNADLPNWLMQATKVKRVNPALLGLGLTLNWPIFVAIFVPDNVSFFSGSELFRRWASSGIVLWILICFVAHLFLNMTVFYLGIWTKRSTIQKNLEHRMRKCFWAMGALLLVNGVGVIYFLSFTIGRPYPYNIVDYEVFALWLTVHIQLCYYINKVVVDVMTTKMQKLTFHNKKKTHPATTPPVNTTATNGTNPTYGTNNTTGTNNGTVEEFSRYSSAVTEQSRVSTGDNRQFY